MKKKRYMVYLDTESTEVVSRHLASLGMTFSGFINAILIEFANEIQGQPLMLDKPIGQMTLDEFGQLAGYWIQKAKEAQER